MWTALYVLVGVAGWRLGRRRVGPVVLTLHGVQLALNALWPVIFFATVLNAKIEDPVAGDHQD